MLLTQMSREQLEKFKAECELSYNSLKEQCHVLNMSRGIPSTEQLELSRDMLDILTKDDYLTADGTDCRNYGLLDGIPEAKELFGEIFGAGSKDEIIIYGNSSLNVMYQLISHAMTHGILGSEPWLKSGAKFLCPVPGYDRHFAICEYFGIEMINIPMTIDGPDMDMVENLVKTEPQIRGIWCVPQYSNPTGIVYSDEVCRRFATLKPKAPDFRIFWDNSYSVHHLSDSPAVLPNILTLCKESSNPDIAYVFSSTSKITFAGSGLGVLCTSGVNTAALKKPLSISTIGYDKLNQLRHVRFLKNADNLEAHMAKHAALVKPRLDTVLNFLQSEIAPLEIGEWLKPKGGYFVSFNSLEGCAKRIVELCKGAGLLLTPAGAAFPYGKDPQDRNIRIAPTSPAISELEKAMQIFCVCVKIASCEKLLIKNKDCY